MSDNISDRFYFDLRKELDSYISKGYTSWTPAVGLFHGMNKACDLILEVGLEAHWNRIKSLAQYFRESSLKLGFELFSDYPSDSVTALQLPGGIDSSELIRKLKNNHNLLVANGQGDLKGKIIRVSHMGNYKLEDFSLLINALKIELDNMLNI